MHCTLCGAIAPRRASPVVMSGDPSRSKNVTNRLRVPASPRAVSRVPRRRPYVVRVRQRVHRAADKFAGIVDGNRRRVPALMDKRRQRCRDLDTGAEFLNSLLFRTEDRTL